VTLEPYQEGAAAWLSRRKLGLVQAPAGAGKTIIAAAALERVLTSRPREQRVKVGWIANTREQCQQAEAALAKFSAVAALAEVKVACAAAGNDWSDRDCLVCDECHHLTAPGWFAQVSACKGAVWGFTATPEVGDEVRDEELLRFFQHNVYRVPRSAVTARLVTARVLMLPHFEPGLEMDIDARTKEVERKLRYAAPGASSGEIYQRASWQAVSEVGIQGNAARNESALLQASRVMADGGRVLMLANLTEHCEWLAEQLGPKAAVCHAKLGKKKRQAVLDGIRDGTISCMVATSLADEGLDVPALDTLVLVSGGRSRVKAEQRTGRVLRAFCGKEQGLIYDFVDAPHALMRKHSMLRVELYRELGYKVEYL
jgi:superfamily II DNA or RNA helicase